MFQSLLIVFSLFGCPKDRTGLSSTTEVLESAKEVEGLMLRMSEVEKRIAQVESITKARGQSEIMKMESMDQVRLEMANMRGELEQVQFQFSQLQSGSQSQQSDVQFRLDWLEERASNLEESLGFTTPPPSGNNVANTPEHVKIETTDDAKEMLDDVLSEPVPRPEEVEMTDKSLLSLAKEHLQGGREEAAEAVLRRVLKEFPKSSLEPEVRYRLAEAAFNEQDYVESARRFQDVLQRHPQSPFASWSLLRQGECFEELDQSDNAKVFYQSVIDEYPKSKAAEEAAEKLK